MTIFSGNQIKFDKNYLDELTSEPNSGVFKQECKYHIALHPAQFNDFGQSIKDELGKKIAKYDESFKGIMLGFTDIRLQSELGVIGMDNCHIHIDVVANFFIFRPEIGMILKGTVTRTTEDHVGCLVYHTFNISLPKPQGDEDDGDWLGTNVSVKSEVEFKITYADLNTRIPYIRGELRSILTEGIGTGTISPKNRNKKTIFADDSVNNVKTEEDDKETKKKKKKRVSISGDPETETTEKKSKNKHKKKYTEELNESIKMEDDEQTETTKKKKKKAKKEKEDLDISLESLDLKSLFSNTSLDLDGNASQTADNSDKRVKRKRAHSVSQEVYLDEVKLEPDSDLEQIIGKGRKKSHSMSR